MIGRMAFTLDDKEHVATLEDDGTWRVDREDVQSLLNAEASPDAFSRVSVGENLGRQQLFLAARLLDGEVLEAPDLIRYPQDERIVY